MGWMEFIMSMTGILVGGMITSTWVCSALWQEP